MKNYVVLLKYCTDAEGFPFLKAYYGLDGINGEFISANDVELGSEYDELITNFCQILKNENMPWLRFKDLTNGHFNSGKNFTSIFLGTRCCTNEECQECYSAVYDATEKLRINLFTGMEGFAGELNNVSKRVNFDQSKGVYTREDIQKCSR